MKRRREQCNYQSATGRREGYIRYIGEEEMRDYANNVMSRRILICVEDKETGDWGMFPPFCVQSKPHNT